MSIEHCPGKENLFADLLSRNPVEEVTEDLSDPERLLPPEQHYTPLYLRKKPMQQFAPSNLAPY